MQESPAGEVRDQFQMVGFDIRQVLGQALDLGVRAGIFLHQRGLDGRGMQVNQRLHGDLARAGAGFGRDPVQELGIEINRLVAQIIIGRAG